MRETSEGVHVGHIFGFPLLIHKSVLLLGPLIGLAVFAAGSTGDLLSRLVLFPIIFASVLVHELAHAHVARALGIPVRHIALTWFGGYAQFRTPPTRSSEIAIALAGPFANIALAGVFILLANSFPTPDTLSRLENGYITIEEAPQSSLLLRHIITSFVTINVGLGVFNLLPGLPLDGGHALRAILSGPITHERATAISAWIGMAIGLLTMSYAIYTENLWLLLIGIFIGASAWQARTGNAY